MKSLSRHVILSLATCGAFVFGGADALRAADLPSPAALPPLPIPDWIVTVSGMPGVGPQYPGSKSYSAYGSGGVSIRRADQPERFGTPDDGFSLTFYETDWLHVGPVARYLNDRPLYHHPELTGLPYLAPALELGAFAEVTPFSWLRGRLEVRQAVTGYDGLVATLSADVWRRWGNVTLSVGPRLNFGSNNFARAYFSVTPQQSAVNLAHGGSLTPYNAVGGLTSAGFTVAARYDYSENWRVTGYGGYQDLVGSVANSPIVNHTGSTNQFTAGLELAYRFRTAGLFNF
ncbi:MipA/OmpV family protein [uncultured Rhodoblastus sp.]|uniref:MipA/OmpV family protein n=1 Tax=uncultured Rhodoblastus sp. TaxID=543037 RepID=UPI0025E9A46C|nr:MipA/OmpV family protein [uncultured Rhodoblastus sp.]